MAGNGSATKGEAALRTSSGATGKSCCELAVVVAATVTFRASPIAVEGAVGAARVEKTTLDEPRTGGETSRTGKRVTLEGEENGAAWKGKRARITNDMANLQRF